MQIGLKSQLFPLYYQMKKIGQPLLLATKLQHHQLARNSCHFPLRGRVMTYRSLHQAWGKYFHRNSPSKNAPVSNRGVGIFILSSGFLEILTGPSPCQHRSNNPKITYIHPSIHGYPLPSEISLINFRSGSPPFFLKRTCERPPEPVLPFN